MIELFAEELKKPINNNFCPLRYSKSYDIVEDREYHRFDIKVAKKAKNKTGRRKISTFVYPFDGEMTGKKVAKALKALAKAIEEFDN